LARAVARPTLICPMGTLVELERATQTELLAELLTEAATRGAIAVLADVDALVGDADLDPRRRQRLAEHPGVLVFTSGARAGMLDAGRPSIAISMPRASLADREQAWRHAVERFASP